jgi:hypothetical protein
MCFYITLLKSIVFVNQVIFPAPQEGWRALAGTAGFFSRGVATGMTNAFRSAGLVTRSASTSVSAWKMLPFLSSSLAILGASFRYLRPRNLKNWPMRMSWNRSVVNLVISCGVLLSRAGEPGSSTLLTRFCDADSFFMPWIFNRVGWTNTVQGRKKCKPPDLHESSRWTQRHEVLWPTPLLVRVSQGHPTSPSPRK